MLIMTVSLLIYSLHLLGQFASGNIYNSELYNPVNQQTFERYTQQWNIYHQTWKNLDPHANYCNDLTQTTYFPICYENEYLIANPEYFSGNISNICYQAQCLNQIDGCSFTPADTIEYNPPTPLSTADTDTICGYNGSDAFVSMYSYGFDQGVPPTFPAITPIRLLLQGQIYAEYNSQCRLLSNAKILAWQLNPLELIPINLQADNANNDLSLHKLQKSHNITQDRRNSTNFSLRDASCSAIQHSKWNGSYLFHSLLPPSYGPPRSIFLQITADGFETLNTRIYFDKDWRLQQLTTLASKESLDRLLDSARVDYGFPTDQQTTEQIVFPGTIAKDPRVAKVEFIITDTRSNLKNIPKFDYLQGYLSIHQDFVLSAKRKNVFSEDNSKTPLIDIDGLWSEDNTGTLITIQTYGNYFVAMEYPHKRNWDVVTGYLVDNMIKGVNFHQNYDATTLSLLRNRAIHETNSPTTISKSLIETLVTAQQSSTFTGTIISSDSFNTVSFNDANFQDNTQTPDQYSNVNTPNPLASSIHWTTDNRFAFNKEKIWHRQDSVYSSHGYRYIKLYITRIMNDIDQSGISKTDINTGQLIINQIIFYEGYFQEHEIPAPSMKMKTPRTPSPQLVTCSSFIDQEHHCFKALDGDHTSSSSWRTVPIRSRNNILPTPQWLLLDLGEGHGIRPTGLRIICDVANAANTLTARGCPMTFKVLVSNDNIQFNTIYQQDLYEFANIPLSNSIPSINPYYGPDGAMFYFQSESSQGLNNGERCGSCLIGPNFQCHLQAYDSLCHSRYCNANGECDAPPVCPPGKYLDLHFTNYEYPTYTCQLCPAGRYGNSSGLLTPYCSGLCQAGYYCPVGSISPTQYDCGDVSVYCPEGSSIPFYAPSGKRTISVNRNDTTGLHQNQTEDCPPGSYCIRGVQYPCPLGTYGNESALQTMDCSGMCPPGTYCPPGSVVPTICPIGYYCSDGRVLRACPAGTYGATKGLKTPQCTNFCSKGYYCLEASVVPDSIPCPKGRYGDLHGLTNANCSGLCLEGYYCELGSPSGNQYACGGSDRFCPAGSFQPTPVSLGYYTIGGLSPTTRTSQQIAGLGHYAFQGILYQCPAGSFGNTSGLAPDIPIDLPVYTYSPSAKPSVSPTLSPTVNPTKSPSHFPTLPPTANPTKIPTQTPTMNPTFQPSTNIPTFHPSSTSELIPIDYLSTPGPTVSPTTPAAYTDYPYYCTGLCAAGYYCPINSTTNIQVPCPAGRYGAVEGLANELCTDTCPLGHYCPSASITPIPCPAGVFGGFTGLIDSTCSPNCIQGVGCDQTVSLCSAGYYCPMGSLTATQYECGGADYYCPVGSSAPIPVTSGYYTVNEDGSIGASNNRANQQICEEGYFCVNGIRSVCPAGRYGNIRGLSSSNCSALCPPGYYCPEGSINGTILRCPAGRYGATYGLYDSSCSGECSPGYHCYEASTSPTQLQCGLLLQESIPDYSAWLAYNQMNGTLFTSPIPQLNNDLRNVYLNEFSYYLYTSATSSIIQQVIVEPNNVYCPQGSSIPLTVLPGYYSNGFNATTRSSQTICPIGSYCQNGRKYTCPGGTYGDSVGLFSSSCAGLCSKGFYCPAGSTSSRQYPCPIGRYGSEEGLSTASCSGACPIPLNCPIGSTSPSP